MPQKTWVVGEQVLASDFNTYVQNQVVARFATTAARDTAWPAATAGAGAVCVTTDTGKLWEVIGGVWVQPTPPGILTGACPGGTIPASGQIQTAAIAAVPPGTYLVTYTFLMQGVGASNNLQIKFFANGTQVFQCAASHSIAGITARSFTFTTYVTLAAAGSIAVNIANIGSASVDTYPDPTNHSLSALRVA